MVLSRDGRATFGPVTLQRLKQFVLTGELSPSDLLGRIGMAMTVKAGTVAGLFSLPPDTTGFLPAWLPQRHFS